MSYPADVVMSFLAGCGKGKSAMIDSFHRYFTPETVWELVGSGTTKGVDEALAKVRSAQQSHGMDHLVSEILVIASSDGSVLTERVDHVRAADGTNLDSCPCMGIFDVQDGKIVAWREYYDTATHG